jgi:hypothetical protein
MDYLFLNKLKAEDNKGRIQEVEDLLSTIGFKTKAKTFNLNLSHSSYRSNQLLYNSSVNRERVFGSLIC